MTPARTLALQDQAADDQPLVAAARAGDDEAFATLYARHSRVIAAYAGRLAEEHTAADLAAEAFARTWQQLQAGQGPREAFVPYVRAVVRNLHLSQLRRDGRHEWVADIEEAVMMQPERVARLVESSPEGVVLEQLANEEMLEALRSLPQRWQDVIVMVYVEGQPYADVARHFELNLVATRQLAHRARMGMRRALAAPAAPAAPAAAGTQAA
jgi:RNA polymerase sigma factor (sigma-70 family)